MGGGEHEKILFRFAFKSRVALGRLELGERQKGSFHGVRYGMGYARTTGRRNGLGAGGRTPPL